MYMYMRGKEASSTELPSFQLYEGVSDRFDGWATSAVSLEKIKSLGSQVVEPLL